jgi:hypothetical protein
MQQKIEEIASRIRELRKLSDLGVENMAEVLDLPGKMARFLAIIF